VNWPAAVQDAADRADATLVSASVRAVSVSTSRVRAWLLFRGLSFARPDERDPPPLWELDRTARVVVDRAANLGAVIGATGAVYGAAGVPPEAALSVVVALRMVQRLAVVYGFELETDRGHEAVTRALAAVWEVALPPGGVRAIRVTGRPAAPPGPVPALGAGGGAGAVDRAPDDGVGRAGGESLAAAGVGAVARGDARRSVWAGGERAIAVLRRLAEVPDGAEMVEEDAEVVPR
jgi:hypothetical protein